MASSLLPPPPYGVGLDIAKDTFTACLLQRTPAGDVRLVQQPKAPFANSARGVAALLSWLTRYRPADAAVAFVLEATGSYYEELAYALHAQGYRLHVCQPLQVKQFARSTSTKSKNDALDARLLATFGLTRALPAWQPFSPQQRHVRALLREQADLLAQRTQLRNRRHAWQHSYLPDPATLARLDAQEALLREQHQAITAQLEQCVAADADLAQVVARLQTIPGLGRQTVLTILAETNGFALVHNSRQLAAYAGLDVVETQSGTSVRGRPRLSRRGNAHLRRALYLPALAAARYNAQLRAFYERLRQRHPQGKAALAAVMRKLLLLAFSLYQSGQEYDPTRHAPTKRAAPDAAETALQDGATNVAPPSKRKNNQKIAPTLATVTQ